MRDPNFHNENCCDSEVEFDYRLKNANADTSLELCLENIQTYVQFQLQPVLAAKEERDHPVQAAARRREAELARQEAELARQEAELAKERHQALLLELNLKLVDIPAGSFRMGSDDEEPIHPVSLKAFKISKYPITQRQYMAVMGTNPSYFKGDENCPVENVSWHDAVAFCQKLSQMIGQSVKLPSEAQWEYACRAGSAGRYYFGEDENQLKNYAWYKKNSSTRTKTHPVGQKQPNDWGLYDMYGNVCEWCEDVWHEDYKNAPSDGGAWMPGGDESLRISRGASWNDDDLDCSSTARFRCDAHASDCSMGFRVVV